MSEPTTTLKEVLDNATREADLDAATPSKKMGLRPTSIFAPENFPPKPARELTLFERNATQMAEVRLITHRQLEAALQEQLRLVTLELEGVRLVIAGDEALLKRHSEGSV